MTEKTKFSLADETGQSATEFALVLPVLALILFGIIQFGVVFNHYVTLTDATRAGARKAAVGLQSPNPEQDAIGAVRSSASDLDQGRLDVSVAASWETGSDVTVRATYPYEVRLLGFLVRSGRLVSTTTERIE